MLPLVSFTVIPILFSISGLSCLKVHHHHPPLLLHHLLPHHHHLYPQHHQHPLLISNNSSNILAIYIVSLYSCLPIYSYSFTNLSTKHRAYDASGPFYAVHFFLSLIFFSRYSI